MNNHIVILFDLDGVIIDTEPQYDLFWRKMGEDYHLGIKEFEKKVKGLILPDIIQRFFSHLPEKDQQIIKQGSDTNELQMEIIPIAGVLDFIRSLKQAGFPLGLVTSSGAAKLAMVLEKLHLQSCFDTIVSSDRITKGKPDPMCFQTAANDLDVLPEQCIVFEDSFHGIAAGNAAGMKVIGLSTTNSREDIQDSVIHVMPDFQSFGVDDLLKLLSSTCP